MGVALSGIEGVTGVTEGDTDPGNGDGPEAEGLLVAFDG